MASSSRDIDEGIMKVVAAKSFMDKVYLCSQGGHKNIFESFTKLLSEHINGLISEKRVIKIVKYDLFVDQPDLLEDFERFFLKKETPNPVRLNSHLEQGKSCGDHEKIDAGKKQANEEGDQMNNEICGKRDYEVTRKELDTYGDEYTMTRSDLWRFKTCTPSYRFLPENYPTSASTGRSDLDNEVLNDRIMKIPEIASKPRQRSKDEQARDDLDDGRYEQDMFFEYAKSTAKNMEALLNKVQTEEVDLKTQPISIKEHLTPQNLRCIQGLYGEHGMEIIEMIHMNPCEALYVILCRLEQKIIEIHGNDFH